MATYNVSNHKDSGAGSLREAIALANSNAGQDTINIEIKTITLDSQIEITDSVDIIGNNANIFQLGQDRLFNIDDNDDENLINVSFKDLSLKDSISILLMLMKAL
ncbi:MAG: hypothetical protein AAF383_00935 [Cyanobacteria bacterium P01_A01_bin.83]